MENDFAQKLNPEKLEALKQRVVDQVKELVLSPLVEGVSFTIHLGYDMKPKEDGSMLREAMSNNTTTLIIQLNGGAMQDGEPVKTETLLSDIPDWLKKEQN